MAHSVARFARLGFSSLRGKLASRAKGIPAPLLIAVGSGIVTNFCILSYPIYYTPRDSDHRFRKVIFGAPMPSDFGILRHKEFWAYYQMGGDDPLNRDIARKYAVQERTGGGSSIVLRIDCGKRFALELDVDDGQWGVTLALFDHLYSAPHQLGWWDQGRWHPFALRWAEIEVLSKFWARRPSDSPSPQASLLLLAPFVGIDGNDKATLGIGRSQVTEAYRSLGLFSPQEIADLSEATIKHPSEDDYRWSQDPKLGWIFGGEYPCYSLRNPAHADGREGHFPFALMREFIEGLA